MGCLLQSRPIWTGRLPFDSNNLILSAGELPDAWLLAASFLRAVLLGLGR